MMAATPWFSLEFKPDKVSRATPRELWRFHDRQRRITQGILRKAMPEPPAIDLTDVVTKGFGCVRLTLTNPPTNLPET